MKLLHISILVLVYLSCDVTGQSETQKSTKTPQNCDMTIPETCDLSCDHGLSHDANGCHMCECEIEICKVSKHEYLLHFVNDQKPFKYLSCQIAHCDTTPD